METSSAIIAEVMNWHRISRNQEQTTKLVTKVYDIEADSDELGDKKSMKNLKWRFTNCKVVLCSFSGRKGLVDKRVVQTRGSGLGGACQNVLQTIEGSLCT